MSECVMRVLSPGPLSTIQDAGRTGYQSLGFPVGGAADPDSMREANLLCGNDPGEATLEMTLSGVTVQFLCDTVIALCGADMAPVVNGFPAPMGRAIPLYAGSYLTCSAAKGGIRTYLAVAGGFGVPAVMGSKSTSLKLSLGGFEGRKLAAGDMIPLSESIPTLPDMDSRWIRRTPIGREVTLRCVPGPQDGMFSPEAVERFFSEPYTVTPASDRMGVRLEGPALDAPNGTDIISDGIAWGSVQIPSGGKPILLLADHQTTGGYAKIATVISADLSKAGQIGPGTTVRFTRVTVEEAQKEARVRAERFRELEREWIQEKKG